MQILEENKAVERVGRPDVSACRMSSQTCRSQFGWNGVRKSGRK